MRSPTKTGVEKNMSFYKLVEATMKVVKTTMADGENVYLRGFREFHCKEQGAENRTNYSKNTTIVIPAHHIPAFKPAKTFATR